MKKILIAYLLIAGSLSGYCQGTQKVNTPEAVAPKPAEVLVVTEESFDFGKIPQGKPVHHSFTVKNTGTTPLKMANVQASCGCTTPEWDRENSIPAGGTTEIKVGYNAQAEGPFTKAITITYNETASKVINIKGEVYKTPASSAPENTGLNDLKN